MCISGNRISLTFLTNHFGDHLCLICVHKSHVWYRVVTVLAFHFWQGEVDSLVYQLALLPCHIFAILIASPNLKSIEIVKIFI